MWWMRHRNDYNDDDASKLMQGNTVSGKLHVDDIEVSC